jgi:hypothetical protein
MRFRERALLDDLLGGNDQFVPAVLAPKALGGFVLGCITHRRRD